MADKPPRRGRGRPVDDATRARVRALHAAGRTRNAIAREVGISGSTVSGIIRSSGESFDRTATVAATEARSADTAATRAELAERRARLSAELLGDAERLRGMLWAPYTHGEFGGKDNVWSSVNLPQPPVQAQRTILASVHQALKDHAELEKHDRTDGADDVASMLGKLGDALLGVVGDDDQADEQPDTVEPADDTP